MARYNGDPMSSPIPHIALAVLAALVPIVWKLKASPPLSESAPESAPLNRSEPVGNAAAARNATANATQTAHSSELAQAAIDRALSDPHDYQAMLDLRRLVFALPSTVECIRVSGMMMAAAVADRPALRPVMRDLYARWAELDPKAAAGYATHFNTPGFDTAALEGALGSWLAADANAATKWINGMGRPPGLDREALFSTVVRDVVSYQKDGTEWFERFGAINDAELRGIMQQAALESWTRRTAPADAMKWARAVEDEEQRATRIEDTLLAMGRNAPSMSLYYIEEIEDPQRRAEIAHEVFWPFALTRTPGRWTSPPDPVQSLETRSEEWPIIVFRDAGNALTRHSTNSALDKARKIPAGPARDAFVLGIMEALPFSDNVDAVRPALDLVSEAQREQASAMLEAHLEARN